MFHIKVLVNLVKKYIEPVCYLWETDKSDGVFPAQYLKAARAATVFKTNGRPVAPRNQELDWTS